MTTSEEYLESWQKQEMKVSDVRWWDTRGAFRTHIKSPTYLIHNNKNMSRVSKNLWNIYSPPSHNNRHYNHDDFIRSHDSLIY